MDDPVSADEALLAGDQETPAARPAAGERRRCRRRPEFAIRRIAPYDGCRLPPEAEFFCAESHDLTSDGASFLLRAHPACRSFVVAICEPPSAEYLVAEVVHSTDVCAYRSGLIEPIHGGEGCGDGECAEGEMGEAMVLVGCRFTGKLRAGAE